MTGAAEAADKRPLLAERVEQGTYIARNERGGQVRVGLPGAEGCFTPGELLLIAAGTCAGLSADHVLGGRLGRDFDATITVEALTNAEEARYTRLVTRLIADMSELPAERRAVLIERAEKAIDRLCTVGRTLEHSAITDVRVVAEGEAQ